MMSCKTGVGVKEAFKAVGSTLIDRLPRAGLNEKEIVCLPSSEEASDDHLPSSSPCSSC